MYAIARYDFKRDDHKMMSAVYRTLSEAEEWHKLYRESEGRRAEVSYSIVKLTTPDWNEEVDEQTPYEDDNGIRCPDCGEPLTCDTMMPLFNGDCTQRVIVCDDCYDRIKAVIRTDVRAYIADQQQVWFNIIVEAGGNMEEKV